MRNWLVGIAAAIGSTVVFAQTGSRAAFDVVSIKRNASGATGTAYDTVRGATFSVTNVRVVYLVRSAFAVQNEQVIGAPDWARRDRYDVVAQAAGAPPTEAELQTMLRSMLADRFKLAAHVEPRELPVYALRPIPDRPISAALRQIDVDCEAIAERQRRGERVTVAGVPGDARPCGISLTNGVVRAGGATMIDLARVLSDVSDRPVIDRSGLAARYVFTVTGAPAIAAAIADANAPPSIFTAVREQLGLRLDAERAPLDTLVIDHIERPDEN